MRPQQTPPKPAVACAAYQRNREHTFSRERFCGEADLLPGAKKTIKRRTASGHHRRISAQFYEPPFQRSELRELLENHCFKIVSTSGGSPIPKFTPDPRLETNYFILL